VLAVVARLVPGAVPAPALAAFLDEHFDQQLGRGDERVGVLPREELIPVGFRVLAQASVRRHGRAFAALSAEEQDALLTDAERGELSAPEAQGGFDAPEGFDATEWFQRVRDLLLLGYGSDPRGMVEMGFPGPSYEKGHVWLDEFEVARRAERAPGHEQL
jgi:hypothetical protein